MTHTSTSPNYQIIASLDVGRRQVELEGYELVQKQVEARHGAAHARSPTTRLLRSTSRCCTVRDMIPAEYRASGIETTGDPEHGLEGTWDAWADDEFALDPDPA